MLSRYVEFKSFKRIPFSGDTFEINTKGKIRDTVFKEEVSVIPTGEGPVVDPDVDAWFAGMQLAVVLAITFRNPILDLRNLLKLKVIHKDGNVNNVRLTNTVWAPPLGNATHSLYKGFCYIPGFSRYLINPKGEVLSPMHGGLLTPYQDDNGYLIYGVQPDVGKRTIVGMHRLLCLAFKDYPAIVDRLDVNHIDAIKHNNDLPNLEWATRSRNNFHANELGLKNSIAVLVRDITSNTVERYYSIEECSRKMGVDGETIRQRINNKRAGELVYNGLFQFKSANSENSWVVKDNLKAYHHVTCKKPVRIESVRTGNTKVFSDTTDAAKFFGVSRGALQYHLRKTNGHGITFRDYLIQYDNSLKSA